MRSSECLRHEPTRPEQDACQASPEGSPAPQFRLRVGDIRVFYDVAGTQVEVLAIVGKADAEGMARSRRRT